MMDSPARNPVLVSLITPLVDSYKHWTGKELSKLKQDALVDYIDNAPFVLLSHGTQTDPILNYGNKKALALWEMTFEEFCQTPSRLTAEAAIREDRERLLYDVRSKGYSSQYSGIRISKTSRRFVIENATVWNILDENGIYIGQAAYFEHWNYL